VNLAARAPGGAPPADFVPYVYGATLGRPSKGRPERVLAHLKTMTAVQEEDEVGIKPAPGSSPRNGRPSGGGYEYGGKDEDTLTAGLSAARLRFEAEKAVPAAPLSLPELARRRRAFTRLPAPPPEPEPVPEPLPEPEPVPEPVKRHRKCGYPFGSVGHKTVCGDA
jgi:hypothetical protein